MLSIEGQFVGEEERTREKGLGLEEQIDFLSGVSTHQLIRASRVTD